MKKILTIAVAGLLFTGAAFAHPGKQCCKKGDKACCKKSSAKAVTTSTKKATTKKA